MKCQECDFNGCEDDLRDLVEAWERRASSAGVPETARGAYRECAEHLRTILEGGRN